MTKYTPKYRIPFPESGDPVHEGAAQMEALAKKVDETMKGVSGTPGPAGPAGPQGARGQPPQESAGIHVPAGQALRLHRAQ